MSTLDGKTKRVLQAAISAGGGAVAGKAVTTATGMAAVGMVGKGAGVGAPAGPVGAAAGALIGLAIYGLFKVLSDD